MSTRGAVAPTATVPTTVRSKTEGTSMSTTTKQKTLIAASAAAISAIGLLTVPAPAQAAPACDVYGFAGNVTIREDYGDGFRDVSFSANGSTAGGPATTKDSKGFTSTGTISGGIIENGPRINLTFFEKAGAIDGYNYTGVIREGDLIATGEQGDVPWSTLAPLACLQTGAQQDPGPKPGDHMFQLTGDVDMFDKSDGKGNKLPGFADGGEGAPLVNLLGCTKANWCNIVTADNQFVWVWGSFVPPEARF